MKTKNSGISGARMGRPPKFGEPRRPITVTLPESTLASLAIVDSDRGRAIVKVTSAAVPGGTESRKSVEVVEVTPGLGIILVGPSKPLPKIKGLRFVEVAPARFLLVIPSGTSIDSLELAIVDALEEAKGDDDWQHSILVDLKDLVRRLRRQGLISKGEMLFIDTGTAASASTEGRSMP